MHNYHDTLGAFPPVAVYDKAGKPLLSWRLILLYVEQDALYRQFRLDEPWTAAQQETAGKSPGLPPPEGEARHRYPLPSLPAAARSSRASVASIAKILDGTSNTVMFVETAEGVPWSKPDELLYDAAASAEAGRPVP
jgi:hypothetical protein